MFKNLIVYRIAPLWSATAEALEAAVSGLRFAPCGATQEKSAGWVEPRGVAHGPLVEVVDGQYLLKFQIETKAVPGSVVRRKAEELAAQIEATTGRKPGKKETKALRDDALLQLLPSAIPRQAQVMVWLCPQDGLLLLDCASQSRADDVVTELVKALPSLQVALLQTNVAPQAAMTGWLTAGAPDEWPAGLSVERECELKGGEPDKSVVKFTRHSLLNDEIRLHISQGKLPTKLALSWEGRVGFVLTEGLQLKKLAFLEGVFDGPDATPANKEERFDTDAAISTGELRKMLADLIAALGGKIAEAW